MEDLRATPATGEAAVNWSLTYILGPYSAIYIVLSYLWVTRQVNYYKDSCYVDPER